MKNPQRRMSELPFLIPQKGIKSKWRGDFVHDSFYDVPLPTVAATYVIYLDGIIVYVGSTNNLRQRIYAHSIPESDVQNGITTPWGFGFCVFIKYRASQKYGDWLMREARLIRRLRPSGNTKGLI